jgi:hypothetical protein
MRGIALALLLTWPSAATAADLTRPAEDADCTAAIATVERSSGVPAGLLAAIGQVESGWADPVSGAVRPWPWTIYADGAGHFFATKAEAVAAVTALRARGVVLIDAGCMQVNLMHHPAAFATLEEAFDPVANTLYAARFLNQLFEETGDWSAAAAAYHSHTPEIGAAYKERVLAVWALPEPTLPQPAAPRSHGFVMPDWVKAADFADREPLAPARTTAPPAAPGSLPSSPLLERVLGIVAGCAPKTTPGQAPGSISGDGVAAWRTPGLCPGSPFAKPAVLRQILAQP